MAEYIERKAAELAMVEKGQSSKRYRLGEFWELNGAEIREVLQAIPAADVKPVMRGEWKWDSFNIVCSECDFAPLFDSTEPLYHYCPNCGADMRGDTNG